jgi:hypothetical protein
MREAIAPLFDPPRRHPRVRTDLPVRCGDDRATLRDVSCGGAFVAAPVAPAVGARVTLRFRLLGSMPCEASGLVAWSGGGGFGVDFDRMSRQMKSFAENLARMPDRLVPLYLAGVLDPALTLD